MWSLEDVQDYLSHPVAEFAAEIEALYKRRQEVHASDVLDDHFSLVRVDFRWKKARMTFGALRP